MRERKEKDIKPGGLGRHVRKLVPMHLCFIVLLLLVAACQPTNNPPVDDENEGSLPNGEGGVCPNIDSQLNQLLMADNPLEAAEWMDLRVEDGKVEVMLTLASDDVDLPSGFDMVVSIRSGDQAQVFLRIDQLCDLANTDEVVYIRVPEYGVPE
jgi:hypothetical protein